MSTNAPNSPGSPHRPGSPLFVTPGALRPTFFDEKALHTIAKLIDESGDKSIVSALDALFKDWGVRNFTSLKVLSSKDVEDALKKLKVDDVQNPLGSLLAIRQLGYIVEYSKFSKFLEQKTDLGSIVALVDSKRKELVAPRSVTFDPSTSDSKKTMPTLPEFSGLGEEYFKWRDTVKNLLGQYMLLLAIEDKDYYVSNKQVSASVFFGLRTALQKGHAREHAQRMDHAGDYDAYKLWHALATYYDTHMEKANATLLEVQKLLQLRLDASMTATQFIADFQGCITNLNHKKAKLAKDNDTLRALLLVAIQDDAYDTIRDRIVNEPSRTVDEILMDLRNKEASISIKDGAQPSSIDGVLTASTSRRAQSSAAASSNSSYNKVTPWKIPEFPNSWKKVMKGFYNHLNAWRNAAHHKRISETKLDEEFGVIVVTQRVENPAHRSWQDKKKHHNNKKRSRRLPSKSTNDDNQAKTKSNESDGDESSTEPPRTKVQKRIMTRKSRKVVTTAFQD